MSDKPDDQIDAARFDAESLGLLLLTTKMELRGTIRTFLLKSRNGAFDSSDLFQQTMITAIKGWATFRGTTRLELMAWLRTIARRLAFKKNRRLKEDRRIQRLKCTGNSGGSAAQIVAVSGSSLDQVVQDEELATLQQLINQLPPQQRDVIRWRHSDHLTFQEIADKLERSNPAARMLYLRALQRLQELARSTRATDPHS